MITLPRNLAESSVRDADVRFRDWVARYGCMPPRRTTAPVLCCSNGVFPVTRSRPRGRRMSAMWWWPGCCDAWADGYERKAERSRQPLEPGLARAGIALLRELPRSAPDSALLCTDLHAENVLASNREPWLVIDPKRRGR